MGIGSAVKNMLSSDDTTTDTRGGTNAPNETKNSDRGSRQLPPGTGPGTSGKPVTAPEPIIPSDLDHSRSAFGYGTDAAAAMGGTLAGTHQGRESFSGSSRTATRTGTSALASDAAVGSGQHSTMTGDQVTTGGQAAPVTYPRAGELGSDTEGRYRRSGNFGADSQSYRSEFERCTRPRWW